MLHLLFNTLPISHINIQQTNNKRLRFFCNFLNKIKFSHLNFFQSSISSSLIKRSHSLQKLISHNTKSPNIYLFIIFFSTHYFRTHIIQCSAVCFSGIFIPTNPTIAKICNFSYILLF